MDVPYSGTFFRCSNRWCQTKVVAARSRVRDAPAEGVPTARRDDVSGADLSFGLMTSQPIRRGFTSCALHP